MTGVNFLSKFELIASVFLVCMWLCLGASAQLTEDRPSLTEKSTNYPKPVRKQSKVETSASLKTVNRKTNNTDRTSYLAVTCTPGATLRLFPAWGGQIIERIVGESGIAEFDKLKPGDYTLSASLKDYYSREAELTIPPTERLALAFNLELVASTLRIETNISRGEIVYTLSKFIGYNPDKSIKLDDTVPVYSLVKINNGMAFLPLLINGYYSLEIRPDSDLGYKPMKAAIKYPENVIEDGDANYVSIKLEKDETLTRGTTIIKPEDVRAAARGKYYALIIGNNDYQGGLQKLETAVRDAEEIEKILSAQYGFETKLLLNAKRETIIDAFYSYAEKLEPNDNLLIYYAGHGYRNEKTDMTYWLPVDASLKNPAFWISSADILSGIKEFPAKHILIISDSCFAGMLAREVKIEPQAQKERNGLLLKLLSKTSKRLIASGGNEPVADGGGNGHSIFARALIDGFNKIQPNEFTANELYTNYLLMKVASAAGQTPVYRYLPNQEDDGGDFVFIRKKQ